MILPEDLWFTIADYLTVADVLAWSACSRRSWELLENAAAKHCVVHGRGVRNVYRLLARFPYLETLVYCGVSRTETARLDIRRLPHYSRLRLLRLEHNGMDLGKDVDLTGLFRSLAPTIQELYIKDNYMGRDTFASILAGLGQSTAICRIHFRKAVKVQEWRMEGFGEHVFPYLKNFAALEEINFGNLHLSDADIYALARVIPFCPVLKRVYLGFNEISHRGIRALAEAIAESTSVQDLSLEWNFFGIAGLKELSVCMPKLRRLNIQGTQLRQDVYRYISILGDIYPKCPYLEELYID